MDRGTGNGSATAASDARRRSVAHRPLAHTLLRSSPVTLNTFTVETAGSALSFHDDTLLSDLTGNLNPGTLNPGKSLPRYLPTPTTIQFLPLLYPRKMTEI